MSKSRGRLRSASPPLCLGKVRNSDVEEENSRNVGEGGRRRSRRDASPRIGDSPVEFVPKSILRKRASTKFSDNSIIEEDFTSSSNVSGLDGDENVNSARARIMVNDNNEDKEEDDDEVENNTRERIESTKSILKRGIKHKLLNKSRSKSPQKSEMEKARFSLFPDDSKITFDNANDEDPFGDTIATKSSIFLPDLNNNVEDELSLKQLPRRSPSPRRKEPSSSSISDYKKVTIVQPKEKESESQRSQSPSLKTRQRKGILLLPEQIFKKIFSFLNQIDLHTCTQVCKVWRDYHDLFYHTPRVFNGRTSFLGSNRTKSYCREFLSECLLTSENRRHFKLFFYNVTNFQMKTIICEKPEEFQIGVRHMSKLHLVNCNLHWKTLVTLLTSLRSLNTFTDTWSLHYQKKSCLCICTNNLHKNQGPLKKLPEMLKLSELKASYTRIRTFKISRRSFTKELCAYFHIIFRMIPYVEEFWCSVGPWHTKSRDKLRSIRQWFPEFSKIFHQGLKKIRRSVKKMKITWRDEGLVDLFDKCVEALNEIEFLKLAELSLWMSDSSMKSPKNLPQLVRFFSDFQAKPGKNKFLHLKAYVAPIFMTREWKDMFYTLQDKIVRRSLHVSLRVGVKLVDSKKVNWNTVGKIFGNYVFFRGLSKLEVDIKGEMTQSLRDVVPMIKASFPNVESLEILVGDRKPGKMYSFRDYSILAIAFNFKLITELRISDQPERCGDLLDLVVGKKERASLTYAYISKKDMVLICQVLTKLRVLKLWANLNDLRDINFTGIKYKYFYLKSDGQYYLNREMLKEKREPSILNLQHLKLLSLRGLGKDVTDITCRYGFEGMTQLQFVELTGDTSITQDGRLCLHSRMRATGCKVNVCR